MKRSYNIQMPGLRFGPKKSTLLARRVLHVAQSCVTFWEEIGHITDPGLWLGYELAICTSVVEGDASEWLGSGNL